MSLRLNKIKRTDISQSKICYTRRIW